MAMTQAQQMLNKYIEAEMAVLEGRSVTFGGRTLTMADLNQIRDGQQEWERRVASETAATKGGRFGYSLATFE
ncbi:primosomal replication protein PriB/PriC domain protein [Pseudomonas sp. gcc21]|uniref:primosomal replication protein PriB/PriC domain protein n=1 Tax=Pseudomonas sp. gcc21 TaxID=2726989 RepID=UPI0014517131|nr:primosomal replication protein PriB/PriC domain protein [Pseudomonas sp. gcc21]QJD58191.1 primosomal replication protein PriB/PriC domain protein [Pseudomonas sp. gcc21]